MSVWTALILLAATPEGEIRAVADAFDAAQLRQDAIALDAMVAADLIFIDGSGKRLGKKEFIDGWTSPGERYSPIVLIDRSITLLGKDGAVVSAETVLNGEPAGKRFASRFRYSDVFRRDGGQWKAVLIQVTRIPLPPAG